MNHNFRFELSFKNIDQLENKLNFCKFNKITNINIPCKGIIKKELFNSTFEYIKNNHKDLNVVFHYSLYHQYSKNKENSYNELLNFIHKCNRYEQFNILLVSGSIKKKEFDVINVLNKLKNKKDLTMKFGIAYNPYLNKYYNSLSERDSYEIKISSGVVSSIWLQYGTDIKLLENEVKFIRENDKYKEKNLFGSLLIPSKQFLARFKFRPWKEVYIANKYLYSLNDFYAFTRDLLNFYLKNKITPVVETDFYSSKKLDTLYSFLKNN